MKYSFTFILICIIVGVGCKGPKKNASLPDYLPVAMDIMGHFEVEQERKENTQTHITLKSGEDVLIIKSHPNMDSDSARNKMNKRKVLVESIFKEQPSPYPGKFSNSIRCPEKYKPIEYKEEGDDWKFSYHLYANKRFVYGGCTEISSYYESSYTFFYCSKSDQLFEIKYFTPAAEPQNPIAPFIQSIQCK